MAVGSDEAMQFSDTVRSAFRKCEGMVGIWRAKQHFPAGKALLRRDVAVEGIRELIAEKRGDH